MPADQPPKSERLASAKNAVVEAAVKLIGESTSERDIDVTDYRCLRMAVQALIEEEARVGQ